MQKKDNNHVLVADVDPDSVKLVAEIINYFFPWIQIDTVSTDLEASRLLEEKSFRVIVVGFSGKINYHARSIIRKAKEHNPNAVIILMSGYLEADCCEQFDFESCGVRYFWQKPFGVEIVEKTFEEIFYDEELENFLALDQGEFSIA